MTEQSGSIPASTALSEARPESLAELLSRDPEGYQKQDLDRIIEHYRAQAEKWKAADAAGVKVRQPRSGPASAPQVGTRKTDESMEDLGL